ncbi:MAG: ThiF family adenylyltransferase [Muribaculaceae bacterium]|nr:ThiF family adenylyltransferase [Muribaculaceae bacterium]
MQKKETYEWGEGVYTLLSWFKKEKVKNARVLVAGAGALGNEVVKNLALFGIGHIYVVDFDRIEISNLTRSVLFREEDAYNHSYKSEIVAKRAMEINPQIKVVPIVGNLYSEVGFGLYKSVDVIIGCLDSRIARYYLNKLAMRAGKTWIDGSIENMIGVVRVFTPGVSCYECGLSREEFNNIMLRLGCADVVRMQENAGRVATTPISASIIGAMQVQEAMKIIHLSAGETEEVPFKTLQGKMLRYEGMTNSVNIYKYASWKSICPAHEEWSNIVKAESLSAEDTVDTVLKTLKSILNVNALEINMRNNKFIDKIVSDKPEKEFMVKIPESQLDDYIANNEELRKLSYKTIFHKDFIENIDETFPYKDMSLKDIGIPLFDIMQVSTEKGQYFVELTKDASVYNLA